MKKFTVVTPDGREFTEVRAKNALGAKISVFKRIYGRALDGSIVNLADIEAKEVL